MGGLITRRVFMDDGNPKREKENLTYTSFINLRQEEATIPISFFRSDFRGSSFSDCHFFGNNFDRADIISCVFLECSFVQVNIAASEIKNCYFRGTTFTKNNYNHTSIQETTFENCRFLDEHLLLNMKNCTLIDCEISFSSFERSTTEAVTFRNCRIGDTDMATMHAEEHKFVGCQICNTSMSIDYIFGYLFYNTDLSNITILYRGDEVKLTRDTISRQAGLLWAEQRFHEYLNANIICQNIIAIPKMVKSIFNTAIDNASHLRQFELKRTFEVLQFYVQNNAIPYPVYFELIEQLDLLDWKRFPGEERIIYLTYCEMLRMYVKDGNYNLDFIMSSMESSSIITIHCRTNDYTAAKDATYSFLEEIARQLGISAGFELIDTQKGSWYFTFIVVTAIALLIPKLVSETVNVSLEVSTKLQIRKRIKNKLKKQNLSTDELKKLTEVASSAGLINGSSFQIAPSNLIDALKIQL